jgi:hypothetical protein
MVASFGEEAAKIEYIAREIIIKNANASYKEKYLYLGSSGVNANIPPEILDERDKGKYLYSSATLLTGAAFYKNIHEKGRKAKNRSICIDMESNTSYPLLLGNTVNFQRISYSVVEAEGTITISGTSLVRSRKYIAVPLDLQDNKAYPPPAGRERSCHSSAQTAFVAENKDPLRMNRVRIRYPWQTDGEDASPWIRMALPMASEYSGFNFIPEVDDEVMVDFENGNMERPYVVGALYNVGHKPKDYYSEPTDYTGLDGETRSITSRNGHRIIFSDPSSAARFFDSFFPLGSLLRPLASIGNKLSLTSEEQKKLAGGIELTDEYGMYSIKMSSHARDITIDSPFGTVNVNAFKGITINAPNGEVSIKGKNITIEAGNNLTLKSGANIANGRIFSKPLGNMNTETVTSDIMGMLSGRINLLPVDLALMRCVLEAILRPIGGTMLIKSHRYMCLEAGKGKTTILSRERMESGKIGLGNLGVSIANTFSGNTTDMDKEDAMQAIANLSGFIDALLLAYIHVWEKYTQLGTQYEGLRHQINITPPVDSCPDNDTEFIRHLNGGGKDFSDVVNWYKNLPLQRYMGDRQNLQVIYEEMVNVAKTINNKAKARRIEDIYNNVLEGMDSVTRKFLDYDLQCPLNSGAANLPNNIFFQRIHRVTTTDFDHFEDNKIMSMETKRGLIGYALNVIYQKITGNADTLFNPPPIDKANWEAGLNKLVNAMVPLEPEKGMVGKALTAAAESLVKPMDGFIDQNVWGNADDGDLLISTKKETTMYLKDDKTIDRYVWSGKRASWQELVDTLKRI